MPLDRCRSDASRSHRRRRRRPAGAVARSAGRERAAHADRGRQQPRSGAPDRPLSTAAGSTVRRARARDELRWRASARVAAQLPGTITRRARFHRPLRRRGAEGARRHRARSTGVRCRGCSRRSAPTRSSVTSAANLLVGLIIGFLGVSQLAPLRRRRLRPRARRRRTLPRARTAGHRDRRRRPIGRRSRVGARHDEGVGGDRRVAVDGIRPDAMAGRASLPRARRWSCRS